MYQLVNLCLVVKIVYYGFPMFEEIYTYLIHLRLIIYYYYYLCH